MEGAEIARHKSTLVDLAKLETEENNFAIWFDEEIIGIAISHITIVLPLEDFSEVVELLQKSRRKFGSEGVLGVETKNCVYRVEVCDEDDDAVHFFVFTFGLNVMLTLSVESMSKFIEVCEKAEAKLKERGLA